ncbi:protein takeout [Anabrus simplex]|uniref:protein takeout n=1 Tax=Anabrus simplex TaxID=316456 RepID=UPI0035A2B6B3
MLRNAVVCLVLLVAVCQAAPSASAIGKKLGLCSRQTPDLDVCLKKRLQFVLPDIFRNGFPELDLEPSDPAYIRELSAKYLNGNWSANIVTKNTKTWGLSRILIHNVRTQIQDTKHFHAEIDFTIPTIMTEGDYKLESTLLGIPINTKGFFNISMINITGTYDVTGVHINKGGEDYVKIQKVDMLPYVGDMKVYASNLIPGNEELSQAAITFFNQNWRFVYQELLPVVNEAWSKYMADAANLIFLRVPFKELFPEA